MGTGTRRRRGRATRRSSALRVAYTRSIGVGTWFGRTRHLVEIVGAESHWIGSSSDGAAGSGSTSTNLSPVARNRSDRLVRVPATTRRCFVAELEPRPAASLSFARKRRVVERLRPSTTTSGFKRGSRACTSPPYGRQSRGSVDVSVEQAHCTAHRRDRGPTTSAIPAPRSSSKAAGCIRAWLSPMTDVHAGPGTSMEQALPHGRVEAVREVRRSRCAPRQSRSAGTRGRPADAVPTGDDCRRLPRRAAGVRTRRGDDADGEPGDDHGAGGTSSQPATPGSVARASGS